MGPKNFKPLNKLATTAWYNMALAYSFMSNFPKAIECYEELLKINPDDIQAMYNLGGIYTQNKQFDEGVKYLKQVLEAEPNNPDYHLAWFTIGHYYADHEQFERALIYLKKASEYDSDNTIIQPLIKEIRKKIGTIKEDDHRSSEESGAQGRRM